MSNIPESLEVVEHRWQHGTEYGGKSGLQESRDSAVGMVAWVLVMVAFYGVIGGLVWAL